MLSWFKVSYAAFLFNPIPISFVEPRLELVDEDLEDEEFQMEETHPNLSLLEKIIREKYLNIY